MKLRNFTLVKSALVSGIALVTVLNLNSEKVFKVKQMVDNSIGYEEAVAVVYYDENYVDKALEDMIYKTKDELLNRYPDIVLNDGSLNAFIVTKPKWNSILKEKENAAYKDYVKSGEYNIIVSENSVDTSTTHEAIHYYSEHGEYIGFRYKDGRGHAINEGMTELIDNRLYKYGTSAYYEYAYLSMMTYFIPEKELSKIYFNGDYNDLNNLIIKYFDIDLVNLMDKDHLRYRNTMEISLHIINAFINYLDGIGYDNYLTNNPNFADNFAKILENLKLERFKNNDAEVQEVIDYYYSELERLANKNQITF